ncbi:hypothetical protein PR202_gb00969 [Eleusine coracana subsp. coracana]|uniref:Uncharacterized protein n=1 Tax=Eleusine coracana subsp. coracana TaxID=191504 RepID=A0AAV5DUR3_ELECO|nr:hypothetical protein PR202_gb00969 [Eleusine coracana subsp. coracana]
MPLPGDVKAEILARVERTCTALRRIVAERDRQLWKPKRDVLGYTIEADDSPEMSWRERYMDMSARQGRLPTPWLPWFYLPVMKFQE